MNKVILVGNLGADPEVRYLANGDAVCKLSVATNRKWTDKNTGEKKEKTEWHRVTCWRKTAEIAQQYLSKGRQVLIEGRIEYGTYEKEGVTHYSTDIQCERLELLGKGGNGNTNNAPDGPEEYEAPPF
jgi:single-strand DNA-binding protein